MPVIIPDVIPGTGMTTAILPIMDVALGKVAWWDILGWMKKIVAFMRFLGMGVPFMLKADAGKVMPEIVRWVRKVRSDLEAEGKLGVAGYCWGGRVSTDLCNFAASDEEGEEGKRLVDAQFCAHPSRIPSPSSTIPTAVSKFNAPYSIAVAEHDGRFDFKIADEIEVKLREKLGDGIGEDGNWEVKGYKGCAHGFAVRASPGNDVEMQAAEEACKQASEWFRKWL